MHDRGRGGGGDPHARGAGRACDRRRGRVRVRARGRARGGPRRGLPRARRRRGRRRSTSCGRSSRCAPTRAPSGHGRSTPTRSSAATRMGEHAAALFAPGTRALTHCNAGGLATGGYGTAVGALRSAFAHGLLERVLVDETRPLLQGARLTAWELETRGHPARGDRRLRGRLDDGARRGRPRRHRRRPDRPERRHGEQDRHLRARRARRAPRHPVLRRRADLDARPGDRDAATEIPIEERDGAEVTARFPALNPAFDVTPAALIAAIVTEHGVHRPPYAESLPLERARMNALVLAAGYATRLRPLTDDVAKSLLPVGGRPMLDWILDKLEEVDSLDAVHVVTNSRYSHDFDRWAAGAERRLPIVVHDDGTTLERGPARRDRRHRARRSSAPGSATTTCSSSPATTCSTSRLADLVALWQATGTASAVAALRLRRPRARDALRGRLGRRRRPGALVRREAVRPREHALSRPRTTSTTATTSRSSAGTWPRGAPPTRRATSSPGCTGASRSTGTRSTAPGSTSATTTSCSTADNLLAPPPGPARGRALRARPGVGTQACALRA